MKNMGFGPAMIVSKIKSTPGRYDTSISAIDALKKAGITDDIIMAMMDSTSKSSNTVSASATTVGNSTVFTTSSRRLGIFYAKDTNGKTDLVEVEATTFRKAHVGGMFTSALTYGIKKIKEKVIFSGANAQLQVDSGTPVFMFYVNESPKNYSLVRLDQKKGQREIIVSEANIFGADAGIKDSVVVPIKIDKVEDGVYKVTPSGTLAAGEYAFFFGAEQNLAYDFGVRGRMP